MAMTRMIRRRENTMRLVESVVPVGERPLTSRDICSRVVDTHGSRHQYTPRTPSALGGYLSIYEKLGRWKKSFTYNNTAMWERLE